MTVLALPTRPPYDRPDVARAAPRQAPDPDPTKLTLSFVITLSGENRYLDAAHILETLRGVTDRLAAAEVSVMIPLRSWQFQRRLRSGISWQF